MLFSLINLRFLQKVDQVKIKEQEQEYSVLNTLYTDFKQSYSDPYVRKLCFWWAVAMGGYLQASRFKIHIK